MSPSFFKTYFTDNRNAYSIGFGEIGKLSALGSFFSYFDHLRIYEFCKSVFSAFNRNLSALSHHISVIILPCAQEKMVWINTTSIVTLMKNAKKIWNFSIMNNPRYSMSSFRFFSSDVHLTIARHIETSRPFLTRVEWYYFNFSEKSFFDFFINHTWGFR